MYADPEELRRRLEADPTDQPAFAGLRDLYIAGGHDAELAELLEYRATYGAAAPEAADLSFRAAEIWLDRLGDQERGHASILRALEKDPLHRSSVERLDALLRERGDAAALIRLFEDQIDALESYDPGLATAPMRAHYYQQIGELWAQAYGRDDHAITYYHRAFELDRTNVLALYCAREVYQKLGDYENATKLLDFEARAEPDSNRRIALYRELAHARADRLGDVEGAIVALKRALALEPSNPDVMGELALMLLRRAPIGGGDADRWRAAELLYQVAAASTGDAVIAYCEAALDAWGEHEAALGLMENTCRDSGRLALLADRYQRLIEPLASSPLLSDIYRRAGHLAEELGNIEEAIGFYQALEPLGDPGDRDRLAELTRRLRGVGVARPRISPSGKLRVAASTVTGGGLAALAKEEVPNLGREADPETLNRLRESVQILRSQGREIEAEDAMRELVELEPGDPEGTSFLELRYRARGDWASLQDLLYRAGQSQKLAPKARILRLREAAGIAEERLRDLEGAVAAYKLACIVDPADQELATQLERLLKTGERWADIIERLETEAARAETPEDKIDLLRKIADMHRVRREDPAAAADTLRRILELKPDDGEALKNLDEIYLRESNWEGLVNVLERQRDLTPIGREKASLDLRLAAVLHEQLEATEEAFAACSRVLERVPDNQEALRRMEAIDQTSGNWERLVTTLRTRADLATGHDRAELLTRAASVAETRLAAPARAAELWDRVIALTPNDTAALAARARCFDLEGKWREALDGFRELAEVATEPEIRLDVLRRIARLLAEHGTRVEAAEAWQAVLAEHEDLEACEELATYFKEVEDVEQLVEVLHKLEHLVGDPRRRVEIMLERAHVLASVLEAPHEAVEVLERILSEVDPMSRDALDRLRRVHVDNGDFARAAEAAEREVDLIDDPAVKTELLLTCAAWYHNELDDPRQAIRVNERVLSYDPYRSDVIAALEDLYIETNNWERLVALIRARYKASTDPEERFRLLEAGAAVCEEHLGDPDRAWEWYRDLFGQHIDRPGVLELVEEASRRLGLPRELIGVYGELAKRAEDDKSEAVWWKKIGTAYASPIGDHARALEAMLRAFALDPSEIGLLDLVDAYALKTGANDRLVRVYEALIEREKDPSARIDWRRRLARTLLGPGGDPNTAFRQLLMIREIAPEAEGLLADIERAAAAAGHWDELLEILDQERERATEDGDRIDILLRAAQVVQEHLEAPDRAFEWVMKAAEVDPGDEHVAGRAMQVIAGLERNAGPTTKGRYWAQFIDFYRELVRRKEEEPEVQVRYLEAIARVQEEYLDDGRAAFETRRHAALALPGHQPSLAALERLAGRLGLWAELARHYAKALEDVLSREAAIDLHRRRARVLTEELDRPVEAIEHYWQLIQSNPEDFDIRHKLSVIYQKAGRWNDLVMLLEKELATASPERGREIILEIAGIWEYRLENRYEALDAYRRALAKWPDDDDARRAIERLEKPTRPAASIDEDALAELGLLDDVEPVHFDDDVMSEEVAESPSLSLGADDAVQASPLLEAATPPPPEPLALGMATPIVVKPTGESIDVDVTGLASDTSAADPLSVVIEATLFSDATTDDVEPSVEDLDPDDVEEIVEVLELQVSAKTSRPPPLPRK
jgi:tetratricopeptide (TPR) repeat protein